MAINKQLIRIIACFTNCRSPLLSISLTLSMSMKDIGGKLAALAYLYCTPSTSQNSNKLLRKIAWRNKKKEKKNENANASQAAKAKPKDGAICQVGRSFEYVYMYAYVHIRIIIYKHTHTQIYVCRTCETVLFMVVRCGKLIMRLSHLLWSSLCVFVISVRVCK